MTNPTVKIGSITLYFSAFFGNGIPMLTLFFESEDFPKFYCLSECPSESVFYTFRSQCFTRFTLFGVSVLHFSYILLHQRRDGLLR